MSADKPRVLLDSNVWRAIVDEEGVEMLRRSARSAGVQIVAAPAVTYEALRTGDRDLRWKLVKALTRGEWVHPMTEAFQEAEEVRKAIHHYHPEWMRVAPDLNQWYRLRADWLGAWRLRARRNPDMESHYISALEGDKLDVGRAQAQEYREFLSDAGVRFEKLSFTETLAEVALGMPGYDGQPFDAWRKDPILIWRDALRAGAADAYSQWLSPWIDGERVLQEPSAWARFWMREIQIGDVPLQWVRWAFQHAQGTRKTTAGTPVDNQISVYLVDCEHFVSKDKAFIGCVRAVRDVGLVPLAKPVLLTNDRSIGAALGAIGEEASGRTA